MTVTQTLMRIATEWARRCFGDEHVDNLQIRSLRNLEETLEVAQVLGVSRELAHLSVDRVYDRPVGELNQELGGMMLTAVVLCDAAGRDPEVMLEREVRRVLAKPIKHFAKRNQNKIDMGLTA